MFVLLLRLTQHAKNCGVNSVVVRCNSVNSKGTLKAVNALPQFLDQKAELEIGVKRELTMPERMKRMFVRCQINS